MLRAIHTDLLALNERDRRFTRYFTITHLYNARVSEDELQTYRNGLAKLTNSLSWGRKIVRPQPIDPARTIFRIDLRDFKWSEKVWDAIIAANPYGVIYNTVTAIQCYAATGSKVPFVRADWFVAAASHPPLYHQVLEMPATDLELEKQLKVDVNENIESERVVRAGFNGSGVSRNNRMIERHESSYGAYWKSYDFGSNAGQKNLFAFPLRPGKGSSVFNHDGGEIIFNLPNGLQAYMLVDNKGHRLDKGPATIVSDPKRPDRAVENGISCMSCHVKGMIEKSDQIRDHVEKNLAGFAKREAGTILALYPAKDRLAALITDDAARFQKAVEESGGKAGTTEPIVALTLRFEAELDLPLAAAELGLKAEEFKRKVDHSEKLSRTIGSLTVEGGTVKRDVLEASLGTIVSELELGTFLPAKWDHLDLSNAKVMGDFVRLNPNVATKKAYSGPVEITVVARTNKDNIRLFGFKGGIVIFNWEVRPGDMHIHRPDGLEKGQLGSVAVSKQVPLKPDTWYTLRWKITEEDMEVAVDNKVVFLEKCKYDLSKPCPIRVSGAGSVVDVKSVVVVALASQDRCIREIRIHYSSGAYRHAVIYKGEQAFFTRTDNSLTPLQVGTSRLIWLPIGETISNQIDLPTMKTVPRGEKVEIGYE